MAKTYELRLGSGTKHLLDGGIRFGEETLIDLDQSPKDGLLNMTLDEGGSLSKRKGQDYVYKTSLGVGPINGICVYKGQTIIAHGTKLYKQIGGADPTAIYTGIANNNVTFFIYNNLLYAMDSVTYLTYDGTTVKVVDPYAPRLTMNRKPDGSNSTVDESWNMLGSKFKDSFNGDASSKIFKLSLDALDNAEITIEVDGVKTIYGSSNANVDYVNGKVTLATAPTTGTNNVVITAQKTISGLKNNILKCNKAVEFSNRMFITGNADLPNYYFASGLNDKIDATYFPQKYMYQITGSDKAVTGFKVHHNKLIVFKEDMTCSVESALGLDNKASFPIQYLNTEIGCDMPNTIQLINNNIVFANTYLGVFIIASTMVPGEKSVLPISTNINGSVTYPGLLFEDITLLKNATSCDHDYKYYICVGNKAYILDYRNGLNTSDAKKNKWFYYDNIKANCFTIVNNQLIYGHRELGMLVKFTNNYNDFGQPIKAIWKSKLLDLSYPDYLKMITDVYVTFRNNSVQPSKMTVKYLNENGLISEELIVPSNNSMSFKTFKWDTFSWNVNLFDKTIRDKARIKKIIYFQVEYSNEVLNENMAIKNLVLNYRIVRRVK